MKKDTINYLVVGLFVIGALLLLFVMLYRITGQQAGGEHYYAVFNNVAGIRDGAVVTYGGYQIGQVGDVTPRVESSGTRYRVQLSVRGDWKIPVDSVAKIIRPSLIADKEIAISEGVSRDYLPPGQDIFTAESADVMTLVNSLGHELNKIVPDLAADTRRLLDSLNRSAEQLALLMNEENRKRVENMFRNADEASASLAQLADGFDRVNAQLDDILQRSSKLVSDNDQDIRQAVIQLRSSMQTVSSHIDAVMYNLESSSRNMNEFSRQLRDHPGIIIGSKPPADQAVTHQ